MSRGTHRVVEGDQVPVLFRGVGRVKRIGVARPNVERPLTPGADGEAFGVAGALEMGTGPLLEIGRGAGAGEVGCGTAGMAAGIARSCVLRARAASMFRSSFPRIDLT